MPELAGGKVGSINKLKKSLKKGGSAFIRRVPKDDSLIVRFLTEPDEWYGFYQHYETRGKQFFSYPCMADDCHGCAVEADKSFRYLSSVVDVTEGRVVPLELPKTLANSLMVKYDKFGTLTDRDYDLTRAGDGFDTTYDATPEAPTKVNLKRYEALDLEEVLMEAWEQVFADDDGDDDDDEDERAARRSSRRATGKSSGSNRKTVERKKAQGRRKPNTSTGKRKPSSSSSKRKPPTKTPPKKGNKSAAGRRRAR